MMATQGESESNEEYEEKKGPCLLAADDQVSSPLKSKLRMLVNEQNKIINVLTEQRNALENENGHLKNEIFSVKDDVEVAETTCIRKRAWPTTKRISLIS